MTHLDDIIKKRRSIRKYLPEVPDIEIIKKIIKTSSYTASPSNTEPIRFIHINSPEIKDKLAEDIGRGRDELLEKSLFTDKPAKAKRRIISYWKYSDFMFDAPVLFAIGVEKSSRTFSSFLKEVSLKDLDHLHDYELSSYNITAGLYLQNFMLKCVDLGLDTCILTAPLLFLTDTEKILNLEDKNVEISCFLTMGYADHTCDDKMVKPLNEIFWSV